MLPIEAPAASTLAASRARFVPSSPMVFAREQRDRPEFFIVSENPSVYGNPHFVLHAENIWIEYSA